MKYRIAFCLWCVTAIAYADIPNGYYNALEGKSTPDQVLATLFAKISSHTDVGYDGLYNVYPTSDVRPGTNQVWDMYSTCTFTHGSKKCGSYSGVCDCYNREHSVPQSWFQEKSPMKSDAFHVIPTDGKVNGQRSNYPLGECAYGTFLNSKSLGRLGSSTFPGFSGTVFEVDDEYKGDFARAYFYMVACYRDRSFTNGTGSTVFTYTKGVTGLTTYAVNLFMKWHRQDPVSEKEIDRNEAIYAKQHNRNPFIDHPCLAEYIWGTKKNMPLSLATLDDCDGVTPTPPPDTTVVDTGFHVLPATNIHATSATLHWTEAHAAYYTLDVYTKEESGTTEVTLISDVAGATATTGGYTNTTDKQGFIRLGSGSTNGSISYANLKLSEGGTITVTAMQYNNDTGAKMKISAGSSSKVVETGKTATAYILDVEPQEGTVMVTIENVDKGSRIYVSNVTVTTGGVHTIYTHVNGYPTSVGNTLSYTVTGLDEEETYYFVVTPQGQDASEEGVFFTEEGWTGTGFVPFPTLDWHVEDGALVLTGMPEDAVVTVYDGMGRVYGTLPRMNKGAGQLYLISVRTAQKQQTIKIVL